MKNLKLQLISVIFCFLSGVSITNANYSIYIDASGAVPTISYNNNPFFFPVGGMSSLWGPSTITSFGPDAWELNLIFAGGDYADFGSSNRGLDLLEPGTGELLDSFSFNYWSRNSSVDLVVFNAYLYTTDAFGNPASESARCPGLCTTAVYDGTPQLVMQGMRTAYSTFDVYLTGTPPSNPSNSNSVDEATPLALLLIGVIGLWLSQRVAAHKTLLLTGAIA